MRRDQGLRVQGRYLVAIGQDNDIVVPSLIGPQIRLSGMLDVQVLEIYGRLVRKRIEQALEEGRVVVAMYPVLIYAGLHLLELKAGERVEGEVEPIFPVHPKVTDEQALCCARQVQDPDYVIHLASTNWTDGTLNVINVIA